MSRVLLGLLTAVALLTPGGASAQRTDRCVDKGAAYPAQSAPASCVSQPMPVVSDKPTTTPQELEGTKRYLEAQLAAEGDREWRCKADHERTNEIKEDALDAVDELSDNRKNGRVSRAEKRATRRIEQSAASVQARAQQCIGQAQARAADIRATLSDPVKLAALVPEWRAEQQRVKVEQERRLSSLRAAEEKRLAGEEKRLADERAQQKAEKIELEHRLAALRAAEEKRIADERAAEAKRRAQEEKRAADERAAEAKRRADLQQHRDHLHTQLVALVVQGQSLAKSFLGGAPPPNLSEQVQGLKKNLDALKANYAYFLGRGEEKELSGVASRFATALVEAEIAWKHERSLAVEVALVQAELNQSKFTTASRVRYFQQIQTQHQDVQRLLATHQNTLSEASSVPAVLALQPPEGVQTLPTK